MIRSVLFLVASIFSGLCAAHAQESTIKPPANGAALRAISFASLKGWEEDDHQAALIAFQNTCERARTAYFFDIDTWRPICAIAKTNPDAKQFFEHLFHPVEVGFDQRSLFTGYYEPEIDGSRRRYGRYQTPIYRMPPEIVKGEEWKTRAEIQDGVLNGRGLEIAYLSDPVEAFYLQIQGSGRIVLEDGTSIRVGFAGYNGHKSKSIAQELARRGVMTLNQASAERIKSWVQRNPVAGRALLAHSPSYVFFRELNDRLSQADGPVGAMDISITPLRSIAVDPKYIPMGAPVWLEKNGRDPLSRLMIAQDVGSAIKGAQRADIYYGTGANAGKRAGRTKDTGRMVLLLPLGSARRWAPVEE